MDDATQELLVAEAKADRAQRFQTIRDHVGDGMPCMICGCLVGDGVGIVELHARFHFHLQERLYEQGPGSQP